MAFLLNSQAKGVSGKHEQSTQTPWGGAPEARGPMQLHRLHRFKAGLECVIEIITRKDGPEPDSYCNQGQTSKNKSVSRAGVGNMQPA